MYIPMTSLEIPASVTTIQSKAFYYARDLESVTFAEGNLNYSTDIYGVIFNVDKTVMTHYLWNLQYTSYVVPESVLTVDVGLWQNDFLEELTIGSNVTAITDASINYMDNLNTITFLNDTSGAITTISKDIFSGFGDDLVIFVPGSVLAEYEASDYFILHTDIIDPITE